VRHTLSVLVENKPGALTRVTSMFARRGYNIESLAVGPTERDDVSRITLRVDCAQHSLEQIEKQMHKLVNVLRVTELRPDEAVERELALITVSVPPDRRAELVALSQVAGAQVADIEQRSGRVHGPRYSPTRGSIASRSPSPRKANATTRMASIVAGATDSSQLMSIC